MYFRATPVLTTVAAIVFINWFVSAVVVVILGGDALTTLPSEDGFVLSSHGNYTKVSEVVWIFSLVYSYLTVGFTPLILSAFLAYTLLWRVPPLGRWIALVYFCLPAFVWLFFVSRATLYSVQSYMAFTAL